MAVKTNSIEVRLTKEDLEIILDWHQDSYMASEDKESKASLQMVEKIKEKQKELEKFNS